MPEITTGTEPEQAATVEARVLLQYGRTPVIMKTIETTYVTARRIAITVLGGSLLLVGVVMIVAPGPAFIVIPAGLAVLGLEFAFARRWLRAVRKKLSHHSQQQRFRRADEHRN